MASLKTKYQLPTNKRTSERSERSKPAEQSGANDRASGALRSERVALPNDAVFSILDHSVADFYI